MEFVINFQNSIAKNIVHYKNVKQITQPTYENIYYFWKRLQSTIFR